VVLRHTRVVGDRQREAVPVPQLIEEVRRLPIHEIRMAEFRTLEVLEVSR
jgi:hypothetical protein